MGHEWQAVVFSHSNGTGCPYCSGRKVSKENNLSALRPDITAQWNYEKNSPLLPSEVTCNKNKKVWWKCMSDPTHEWEAQIASRTNKIRGAGCPCCAGKRGSPKDNLEIDYPNVALEWNSDKNGTVKPSEVTSRSTKTVWWICDKGHQWQESIRKRTMHSKGCPQCAEQ